MDLTKGIYMIQDNAGGMPRISQVCHLLMYRWRAIVHHFVTLRFLAEKQPVLHHLLHHNEAEPGSRVESISTRRLNRDTCGEDCLQIRAISPKATLKARSSRKLDLGCKAHSLDLLPNTYKGIITTNYKGIINYNSFSQEREVPVRFGVK